MPPAQRVNVKKSQGLVALEELQARDLSYSIIELVPGSAGKNTAIAQGSRLKAQGSGLRVHNRHVSSRPRMHTLDDPAEEASSHDGKSQRRTSPIRPSNS
jgi:hypothetical protein